MGEIIAQFSDGRLLVNEDNAVDQGYKMSGKSTYGVPFRIGNVKTIQQVVSLEANVSGIYGAAGAFYTSLKEAKISGDTVLVVLRRADQPHFLSGYTSGLDAYGSLAGITSGLGVMGELTSGLTAISGLVRVTANVIGY